MKIMSSFEGKNMQRQYSVSGYRIDLCFHYYKLAIETDENGHRDRHIGYKIKRQKEIEQELNCEFIRIYTGKIDFNIFKAIGEIFRHIKESSNQSTEINLINFQ